MKEITAQDFSQLVLLGGNVVLDFYSTECPPCEALAPKFESLSELYGEEIEFFKIFRQGNRDLAESLGVKSSPTVMFYKNGEEISNRLTGGIKRSEIINNLNKLIGDDVRAKIEKRVESKVLEYDVVILGGGPAGLTAGLYLGQAKVKALLIDSAMPGGHVSVTHQVSNYPGFIQPQLGYMLSHNMAEQAKLYGLEYKLAVDITRIDLKEKEIEIDGFETIKAKKIIIATGTSPNSLNINGEKEFKGKGVSYCATCDAKYYEDKEVVVIGGGNSAVEEAEFISKFASKITIIHQFDALTANKQAQQKIFKNNKVDLILSHEPRWIDKDGDKFIIHIENVKSGLVEEVITDGIFIFIGMKPNTYMINENIQRDSNGFIIVDEDMKTNIADIYAIGDVVSKKYRQITTAVSDGTIAAISISKEMIS